MPDKATTPVYDKCTSCAFASKKGPVYGPWPTSHTDVCCLYKFNRQEHSAVCQRKLDVGQKPKDTCDGLCKDCPSRLKFQQLQVELPAEEPPQRSTDAASQEGTTDVPPSCTSVHPGLRSKLRSKIAPRKRRGFTKLTIEIRPPRFKKKLWFGTWQEEEVDRAKDAINFYMGNNEPFILPDSPVLFAQHPLEIEYRELHPSCEDFIQVGRKKVRASVYFARGVKAVVKSITRGKKLKTQLPLKSKPVEKIEPSQQEHTHVTHEPSIMSMCESSKSASSTMIPCEVQSGSTSSSVLPCASGSQISSVDDMVWYGASSEENSELALAQPSFLPPSEMLPYEEEIPIESELFRLYDWDEETFSLEGNLTFSSSPTVEGEGESGAMEDNGFTASLWS